MVSAFYKFFIFGLFFLFLGKGICLGIYDPREPVNNRVGVHILFVNEVEMAAELVNSNGGDWGYVTIPIQSVDRDLAKWQKFMDDCRRLHLVPILRIATFVREDYWTRAYWYEEVDYANFLDSLDWPVANRYVIIYNEPNRAKEWGRVLSAEDYAKVLSTAYDAFKRVNENFFILPAGFDAAAPSNSILMDEYEYLRRMAKAVPDVFEKIDGWSSHSYPNPGFSGSCYDKSRMSIIAYKHELEFLKNNYGVDNLPVFITETGWSQEKINREDLFGNYRYAFEQVWNDKDVVAVTVFLLNGESLFDEFTLISKGEKTASYKAIASLKKVGGKPKLEEISGQVAGLTDKKRKNNLSFYSREVYMLRERLKRMFVGLFGILGVNW